MDKTYPTFDICNLVTNKLSNDLFNADIMGRGYGETQLINHCGNGVKCIDDEHEINRRSEFIIVNL